LEVLRQIQTMEILLADILGSSPHSEVVLPESCP